MKLDRSRLRSIVGTVRFRITALATVLVALVLTLTGFVLVTAQRHVLTQGVDSTLRQRVDAIIDLGPDGWADRRWGAPNDEDNVTQVLDEDGDVVTQSANMPDDYGALLSPPTGFGDSYRERHVPIDDDEYRLLSRRARLDGDIYIIHVGTDIDEIHEGAEVLGHLLLGMIPFVTVLLAALVWILTGRTLRPVEAIRSGVAAMGGSDLDHRVPVPPGDDEIARLARTMNAMLDRVEEAQRRQQRFVSDASHELRTPLTRIRSELEVDLAHPEQTDLVAAQRRVLGDTIEMQGLVDDLLHLARADAGALRGVMEPVDVDDLVLREARRLRERGQVTVDVSGVSAAQTVGDAADLGRMVRNLADNAEHHAHGTVRFTLAEQDGSLELEVLDDGPGIAAADRERIFERFTRLDDARARDSGGVGLGLAIVREIVARHNGTVAAADPPAGSGPGARLVVRLPVAPEPSA